MIHAINLTEENRLIDPKEGPGKGGVLVLAYKLMKDQCENWHAGPRSLIQKPANISNLFLLLRAKRLQLIIKRKQKMT